MQLFFSPSMVDEEIVLTVLTVDILMIEGVLTVDVGVLVTIPQDVSAVDEV